MNLDVLEKFRVMSGPFKSIRGRRMGMFFVKLSTGKGVLKVLASPFDGTKDWEHVSVSIPGRCPTWGEMCMIKDMFWTEEDTVIQFHPPESEYINNHPTCLHLWRNTRIDIATPPSILVGIK